MTDEESQKLVALRELSDADRAYRAAFQELTTAPRVSPSSFSALHLAVSRLEQVVRELEESAGSDEE